MKVGHKHHHVVSTPVLPAKRIETKNVEQVALEVGMAPGIAGLPVQRDAKLPAPQGQALGLLLATDGLERVKAPWSAHAEEIAAAALEAANGKRGAAAITAVADAILGGPELKDANISFSVSHKGSVIAQRGTADAINPCSNGKLITAAYALHVLGPTHRFATDVLLTKDGDLVVKGAFDPTLTTESLIALAQSLKESLKKAGIDRVPRVLIDNSALSGGNVPAAFEKYRDQDWEYLARPEALSVNKNLVHVTVHNDGRVTADQDAFALQSRVQVVPPGEFKVAVDELDTAGVLERDASGKAIVGVWGTIASDYTKGKELKMKSPAPVESFIDRLAFAFKEAGIAVGSFGEGSANAAERVHTHRSAPLAEILQESVAVSNAFDHEMFALAASMKENKGAPVTLRETSRRIDAFLHDVLGGEGTMPNASGIGNEAKLRSVDILKLFARAETDARLHPLLDALAVPGMKSTIKTRMLDTPAEKLFRGKTGTGNRAVALSGVVGDGRIAFSLFAEKTKAGRDNARAALDAMAIALSTLVQEKRA